MGRECYTGVDLGQSQDFTAIAVLERVEVTGDWDPYQCAWRKGVEHRLRHLERVALGTPYPEVVERVGRVVRSREVAGPGRVVVDATGVGRPVVDLLRQERLGCVLMPVLITGGDRESVDGSYYTVPKRDLITGLRVMLAQGSLQIAAGLPAGELLVKEMAEMRVKVGLSGRETYGAWREGAHDDLVLAVALACWGSRKLHPRAPTGEYGFWRREEVVRPAELQRAVKRRQDL